MSRYGDPRGSTGNVGYREPPPRWDNKRFADERERRVTETIIDRERIYDDRGPAPRRAPVYEEDRYYEDDVRYSPRGGRQGRRFYEEDEFYDPRASRGQMVPFRPPPRPEAPPRPGLLRRQSSLDTFDRQPARRYQGYDDHRPPPRVNIPLPPAPDPRRNSRYEERDVYEDVRIQEPDRYGDDGFREYKEREWISRRRRNSSHSRDRGEVIEKEEIIEEKPFPRRGKTKMPKRLVHTKVLYDLGYPYYEENDTTIIIEKALGPQNIDEIINMSKDYFSRETVTTRLLEAPPAPPEIREEKVIEEIKTVSLEQAPASVQNWDGLRSPSPKSHRSHRSRSRKSRSRRGSSPGSSGSGTVEEREIIIEKTKIKEHSPARTARSHRSRRRSSSVDETEIIERKIIHEDDFDESNSVALGPLALVVDHRRKSRNDRDIKDEIRRLEAERRALRKERDSDVDIVKIERIRERSPSRGRGEIIVANREEVLEVRKDKRARSRSVAPSPGIIRAMMATLT